MRSPVLVMAGLALVALGGVVGFGVNAKFKKLGKEKEKKAIERAFYAGTMPVLGPPWTKTGSVNKLTFKVIPLGKVTSCKLSERGDLLAWGAENTHDPDSIYPFRNVYYLCDPLDQVTKLSGYDRVDFFPNGELVKATVVKQPEFKHAARVEWHGTTKFVDDYDKVLGQEGWHLGSEFLVSDTSIFGQLSYFSSDLVPTDADIAKDNAFHISSSTTDLGDVGTLYKLRSDEAALGFFRKGKIIRESIPLETASLAVTAGGQHVVVNSGRLSHERIPYLRTGPTVYERMAIPPDVVQAEVVAINKNKTYLLECLSVCIHAKKHPALPYDIHHYYIDRGVAYDADELADKYLHWRSRGSHASLKPLIDDKGDMVFQMEDGMYLFRRQ